MKNRAGLRQHAIWHRAESLESRRLLSGTWTSLSTALPASDGAENAMLLTDGTVIVHGGAGSTSTAWYKLTPNNGYYVNGTWSTLASMGTARLFFPSEVLPSGKVWIQGGEYSAAGGFINTGEIYDPVANSWSNITTFPQSQFGDDPTELLPNGNILSGYINNASTYVYSTSTNTWSLTGAKLRNDPSDEESWVTLPDGTILSYDVYASVSTGTPHAQRYNPSTGTWVDAGNPPAQLSAANVGYELGPAMLLPDGRAFYAGGTNATAYYNYSNNTWTAGPNMPNGYVMADSPGAVLPNGHLLLAMSPKGGLSGGTYNFPSPTYVYELDPITNIYTLVTPSIPGFSMNQPSYKYTFLVLPTGQVMMTDDSGTVLLYTPGGSPIAAWAPQITNITNDQGTNTFTVTGYQLNGISEGAGYGDDDEASSNYPIVELSDQHGNIAYARTSNWSTGSVASVNSSFNFTEPATGEYLVNVIANGIASPSVLDLQCSSTTGENWIAQQDANANYVDFNLIGTGVESSFYIGNFSTLIMTGDAASNTLVINANLDGRNTIINGGDAMDYLRVENNGTGNVSEYGGNGDDYFDFGFYGQNLSNQQGFVDVYGGPGTNSVFMYDKNYNNGSSTYTLDQAEVNRPGFGGMFYDAAVQGLTVNTGSGANNNFNISSTYAATPVFINCNSYTYVNIGLNGSVQGINAAITLIDPTSYMVIDVDDSADGISRTATFGSYTPSGDTAYGSIAGLSPGQINFRFADTYTIDVATGTGSGNVVNIPSTTRPLTLDSGAGSRVVNIGNPAQGVQGIDATLTLNASAGGQTINLDDSEDTTPRTTNLFYSTINYYDTEIISGLSPAFIQYYWAGTNGVNIRTGTTPGNVTNVEELEAPLSITGNSGTSGDDTVNVGESGSLANVTGAVTIANPPGYTDINLNDSTGTSVGTYSLSSYYVGGDIEYGRLTFPSMSYGQPFTDTLSFASADVKTLTIAADRSSTFNINETSNNTVINEPTGGTGNAAVLTANILTTTAPLTINAVQDQWTINAGYNGSSQLIDGPVTVNSSNIGSQGEVFINDSADTVPRRITLDDGGISGLTPGQLEFSNAGFNYNISAGSGGNTVNVLTTPVGGLSDDCVINDGAGNDTVTVDATQEFSASGSLIVNTGAGNDQVNVGDGRLADFSNPVTVNGGSGNDSVTMLDQISTFRTTYNITPTTAAGAGFTLTYSSLSALKLESSNANNTINVNGTYPTTPVTLAANAGTDTININQSNPNAPVTIQPSGGSDAVNVDTTGGSSATAVFAASQSIGLLTIGTNGVAVEQAGPRVLLQDTGVVTTGYGVLDQVTNDTIVHSSSLAAVNALVKLGYNAGGIPWEGAGITSAIAQYNASHLTAIGVILNTYDGTNTIFNSSHLFDGVAPSVTDVLTKYTYFGDANLDGKVDGSDYSRIDAGYVGRLTGWYNGDFNYDGIVNGSDYALIDNTFNSQGTSLAAQVAAPAAVAARPFASKPIAIKAVTFIEPSQYSEPVATYQFKNGSKSIYWDWNQTDAGSEIL